MSVARTHTRFAGGIAVIAVAAVVALPAGASAASSGSASAASGEPAAVASGSKARKKCRGNKVAVRKRGKVRCVRKRRAGGDALRDGGSRQTQPQQQAVSEQSPAIERVAPAEPPALPEQLQSTDPPAAPADNQSLRADSYNELLHAIQDNTFVGGAARYYRQGCRPWWIEYNMWVRQCWSNSDRAGHSLYEWEYYTVYGTAQVWATLECVYGTCVWR